MKVSVIGNVSKGKVAIYDDTKPIATKVVVSNEKLTKFRANSGNIARGMKKYIAVIYEVEEEI